MSGMHTAQRPCRAFEYVLRERGVRLRYREAPRPAQWVTAWRRRLRRGSVLLAAPPDDVVVLDFDGVIADSQHEVSSAGIAAAAQHCPHLFAGVTEAERAWVVSGLVGARARLVKAFESMVMARLILEDDRNVAAILQQGWDAHGGLLERSLERWGERREAMLAAYDQVRSALAADLPSWLAKNQLYPGVAEALADCRALFYVASSKRGDRLSLLLNELLGLGVEEGSPRVLSSLIPPSPSCSGAAARDPATALHFIDDRFDTIEAVAAQRDLRQRYNMYLADWGYNTAEERAAAGGLPGVRLLSLPQFCELLRFGIVMGVDDGCQVTASEAVAGVYTPYNGVTPSEK